MWLSNSLLDEARALEVRVFYLSYAACRRWAEHRDKGEPLVFSGWYWTHGKREAGPFKSQSAAWRDAWYLLGRHRAPLLTAHNEQFERERNAPRSKAVKRRKYKTATTHAAVLH
jgi:hypothetical protein